jgi:hypothetical protein
MDMIAFVLAVLSALCLVGALVNLAPHASWQHVAAYGMFARREHFTAKGWRYKNISIGLASLALAIFLLLFLL